jgi:hypothetical protein
MTDDELTAACEALEPSRSAHARMESRVMTWLDAEHTPLLDEWLAMFRMAPIRGLSFSLAAAVALVLTTPLGSLLQLLP